MKRLYATLLGAASFAALTAQAASVDVQWQDPREYRDIEAVNMSQQRFEQRVIRELTRQFEETAARLLPASQTLQVNVHDVDLAGDIEYFFHTDPSLQEMRVIRDLYFPRLDFSYELRGEDGGVIASGEAEAEDRTFYYMAEYMRDDPLYFEKRLIEKWFYRAFPEQIEEGGAES